MIKCFARQAHPPLMGVNNQCDLSARRGPGWSTDFSDLWVKSATLCRLQSAAIKILLKRFNVLFYWGFCWIIGIWLRYQKSSKRCSLLNCALLYNFICVLNVLICLLSIVWLKLQMDQKQHYFIATDLACEVNNEFSLLSCNKYLNKAENISKTTLILKAGRF